ncbi:MAG: hypothetical protein RLZZ381_2680 [Cyanobacteriota bacterium]|jgi:hypothetical protein
MYLASPMKKTPSKKQRNSIFSLFPTKNRKEKINSNTEQEALRLSVKDSELFIAALQNPPQPSEGLLSVFQ